MSCQNPTVESGARCAPFNNFAPVRNQAATQNVTGSVYNGPVHNTYITGDQVIHQATTRARGYFLNQLNFMQMDSRRHAIQDAHAQTCEWLLGTPEYKQWLDEDQLASHRGFLWIKGKPAMGKSTVIKFISNHVQNTMSHVYTISFFFNARGDSLEKSTTGMYRSLLLQLLTRMSNLQNVLDECPVTDSAINSCQAYQWTIGRLQHLLRQALRQLGERELICFIDALDECDEDQIRDMVRFFEKLGDLRARFRTCFSSRHYPHISIGKSLIFNLDGQQGHQNDLTLYLADELRIGSSNEADQIRREILGRASGIFLWVVLVVQILNREYDRGHIHALRKRLTEIPNELELLFQDILADDGSTRFELTLCLQWVLFAARPLSFDELYWGIRIGAGATDTEAWTQKPEAVTADDMVRFVLNASNGLIEVTQDRYARVQFIHESVRNFLYSKGEIQALLLGPPETMVTRGHDQLKQCCLDYVQQSKIPELQGLGNLRFRNDWKPLLPYTYPDYPLLEYAETGILYHSNQAEKGGSSQEDFLHLLSASTWAYRSQHYQNYLYGHISGYGWCKGYSVLYVLVESNYTELVNCELKRLFAMDCDAKRDVVRLYAIVKRENEQILRELLSLSIAAELSLVPCNDPSPHSGFSMVPILLVDEQGDEFDRMSRVHNGQSHTSTICLLSSENFNAILSHLNARNVRRRELIGHLNFTSPGRSSRTINLPLIRDAVKVKRLERYRWDPTHPMCEDERIVVAKLQCTQDITMVEALQDTLSQTTDVHVCARIQTSPPMNEVLPECPPGLDHWTPLSWAASRGHIETVKLLLTCDGVDINRPFDPYGTPLKAAAEMGHAEIVRLLLTHRSVKSDKFMRNASVALSRALDRHHTETAKLIAMSEHMEMDELLSEDSNCLHKSVRKGNVAVTRILLARSDSSVLEKLENSSGSLLYLAIDKGHTTIVDLLLACESVDVNFKSNKYSCTPLHCAAMRCRVRATQLLLGHPKVMVNETDIDDATALHLAAEDGYEEVVELLLAHQDIDVHQRDKFGLTPAETAILKHNYEVAKLIRSHGHGPSTPMHTSHVTKPFDRSLLPGAAGM